MNNIGLKEMFEKKLKSDEYEAIHEAEIENR
jgi:hypothetical protein